MSGTNILAFLSRASVMEKSFVFLQQDVFFQVHQLTSHLKYSCTAYVACGECSMKGRLALG
jgi:hypothetical protein